MRLDDEIMGRDLRVLNRMAAEYDVSQICSSVDLLPLVYKAYLFGLDGRVPTNHERDAADEPSLDKERDDNA